MNPVVERIETALKSAEASLTSAESAAVPALSVAKNYGLVLFGEFMLPFQIAGAMLLAAMVGVIVVAQQKTSKKIRKDA